MKLRLERILSCICYVLYSTKFSKQMINMQHHSQLLCYIHPAGKSQKRARDNAQKTKPKTKPKNSAGLAISVTIPRNTRIRQMLKHIAESISWNSPDHRQVATIHSEIEGPSE